MQITVNGAAREVPPACTVADLVELLALPVDRVAIERNGAVVARRSWGDVALVADDKLEVVTFVGGG